MSHRTGISSAKYDVELKKLIHEHFVTYIDAEYVLTYFHKYDGDVLIQKDLVIMCLIEYFVLLI